MTFDWNLRDAPPRPPQPFQLFDETLRDGLQSPSVTDPPLESKLQLLELMVENGIHSADLGMPGAHRRIFHEVVAMCRHIQRHKLRLDPGCAARTVVADIAPVVEAVQQSGQPLVVYTFIGSSPIRQFAEGWDREFLLRTSLQAIDFAVKEGLEVAFVTEDTVRTPPHLLEQLYRAAVEHGARRLVVCDTVGHATPSGASSLVRWTRQLLKQLGVADRVQVEWHGHNDRGLAVVNALAALEGGAQRLHGCALGIGERVGNTSLDLLLLNLKLVGWVDHDLSGLVRYAQFVSQAVKFPIPSNYPLSGADAFRTATGVHAAAIIKAQRRGDAWLADRVYSGVPATEFGKSQEIEIGHMSGMSNVRYWLEQRGIPPEEDLCHAVLDRAKHCAWTLTDSEILEVVRAHGQNRAPGPR
ncbi:MAG: LeuA family protein [Myxococcota bacterium]|nr:LeuA family protein [Myxococcota bacterium]